jgi:hypothetical protein
MRYFGGMNEDDEACDNTDNLDMMHKDHRISGKIFAFNIN